MAKIINIVCLELIGWGILSIGIKYCLNIFRFKRKSIKCVGEIIDFDIMGYSYNKSTHYYPIICYETEGGTPVTFRSEVGTFFKPKIGAECKIWVLRTNQSIAMSVNKVNWGIVGVGFIASIFIFQGLRFL